MSHTRQHSNIYQKAIALFALRSFRLRQNINSIIATITNICKTEAYRGELAHDFRMRWNVAMQKETLTL